MLAGRGADFLAGGGGARCGVVRREVFSWTGVRGVACVRRLAILIEIFTFFNSIDSHLVELRPW